MKRITKLFSSRATSIDEVNKTVRFRISDNKPDRMGEIVDQKSWNFKDYLRNPILLWGHDPSEPENVLGTALSLAVDGSGAYTDAELQFDTEINPKAALVYEQVKKGTLNSVSVGFINHLEEMLDGNPVLKDNELLEISVVPIPANPRAIALSLKAGEISRKDAKWLMEGMRKEADLIAKQLEDMPPLSKEKNMSEEQAAALLDAVTKLTEKVEAQNATITDLTAKVAANTPAAETDEEKKAREDKEAADKEAADKAAADAQAEAEKAKTPPAKDGDDDQSGAGDDDFDPDAELTPEQLAEAEAALATV